QRHPASVPDRVRNHVPRGRRHRRHCRHHRGQAHHSGHLLPLGSASLVGPCQFVCCYRRWTVLRRLPGQQGFEARSHRRLESGAIGMRLSDSREAVRMALDTLRKNKLRSGLTVLGISIGIATVILISSAINGLNTNIDQFVKSLGTNDLWVFRFEPFGQRPTTEELNRKQLTYEDGIAMRSLPYVVAVDPGITYQNFQTGLGSVSLKAGTHKIQNTILNGNTSQVMETQVIERSEER